MVNMDNINCNKGQYHLLCTYILNEQKALLLLASVPT